MRYENRARVFGWWKHISTLARPGDDRGKLDPVTGDKLEYVGRWPLEYLLSQGDFGFLDMVKGRPVFAVLTQDEVTWLRSVVRPPPRYEAWDDEELDDGE